MTVLPYVERSTTEQDDARRIKGCTQPPPVHGVDERAFVSGNVRRRLEGREFRREFRRQEVVRVECEHPGCSHLFDSEAPLFCMRVEGSRQEPHIRKLTRNCRGPVS